MFAFPEVRGRGKEMEGGRGSYHLGRPDLC